MNYAEAAYFDGNHCHHVATYKDAQYLKERRQRADRDYRGLERRRCNGTN